MTKRFFYEQHSLLACPFRNPIDRLQMNLKATIYLIVLQSYLISYEKVISVTFRLGVSDIDGSVEFEINLLHNFSEIIVTEGYYRDLVKLRHLDSGPYCKAQIRRECIFISCMSRSIEMNLFIPIIRSGKFNAFSHCWITCSKVISPNSGFSHFLIINF